MDATNQTKISTKKVGTVKVMTMAETFLKIFNEMAAERTRQRQSYLETHSAKTDNSPKSVSGQLC